MLSPLQPPGDWARQRQPRIYGPALHRSGCCDGLRSSDGLRCSTRL